MNRSTRGHTPKRTGCTTLKMLGDHNDTIREIKAVVSSTEVGRRVKEAVRKFVKAHRSDK